MSIEENYLVSIIVPAYNVEKYIKSCLISLKNQSYRNIQIIVVNDGSTDNTECIIDEVINDDLRFQKINQKNQGLVSAISTGVNAAKGQYVAFVDGDDYVGKDFILNFLKNINASNDILSCGFFYNYSSKKKTPFYLTPSAFNSDADKTQLINTLVFNNSFKLSNTFFVSRRNKLYKLSLIKKIIKIFSTSSIFLPQIRHGTPTFLYIYQIISSIHIKQTYTKIV